MEDKAHSSKRKLPPDLRVCQCAGCFKHDGIFENSEYCGSPFLLDQGTECDRCHVANCPTCAILCTVCKRCICRECDLCEWCDRFTCRSCVKRKYCDLCNKGFCDSKDCSAPMDECTYCGRHVCGDCDLREEVSMRSCAGRADGCTNRCCQDCPTKATLLNCPRCGLDLCLNCLNEHKQRDCRG